MDWLARASARRPDAPAVVGPTRTISYRELDAAATGVADMIASSGSLAGAPVGVLGERTVETVAAVWGIPRAGVPAVVVDPNLAPGAAMSLTKTAGVRGLWTTPEGGLDRLIDRGGEPVASGPPDADARYVVFTSGTSGERRGVVLTGRNIEASVSASRRRLGNGGDDAWLLVLPLFHVGGLSILWRQAEMAAPVVLHERFEPEVAAAALDEVGFASLVPVMLSRILETGRQWSGSEVVLIGGAGSPESLLAAARERGIPAMPTYGMTETCSQIATPSPDDPLDGTVGRPLDGAEVRIGEGGRIEVRGPMISPAYVGADPRGDEWFATGDVGNITTEGRLVVLGRADHVIVTGGENVHPLEVERALADAPGLIAVRVYGEPDPEWGQRVVADVDTDSEVAALDEWAERHLPASWRPRRWRVVDRVSGKLDVGD